MPDSPADGRSPAEGGVEVDVVGVGAGFAGLYLIHRMRRSGLSCVVLESADDIGGTWYWNRYPGARCDIQSLDYSYSFDPELETEWEWSEKYATQPEILRYMHHVADKHDLRRDIRFSTRVEAAEWDDDAGRWTVRTEAGDTFRCRYYVMATGCLSIPKDVDIPGVEDFGGRTFQTGRWPHEEVDFRGRRVAVIGTGSSAIQSIPLIAAQAAELTVFQRTPNFSFPAHNGPIPEEKLAQIRGREAEYREEARWSRGGVPAAMATERMADVDEAERVRRMETAFDSGELFRIMPRFVDVAIDPDTNEVYAEFIRDKIRSIVDDPVTAEKLCPRGYPVGTKRPCLDTGYYETYNQPHVRLHDLRDDPIVTVTEDGLQTEQTTYEFDDLVLATGFDAMTGALVGVDIRGRDGVTLADRWRDGPVTYLGLTAVGFPNLFMVTGPGSPSVLSNMMVSIEQHIDWIGRCIDDLSAAGLETIEPTPTAEAGWVQHTNDCADLSLLSLADSWYMGANVPGKPRVCLPYVGGVDAYRRACDDVAEAGYLGFTRTGPAGAETNDGVVRRLQPDVFMVLDLMAQAGAPAIETLDPATARQFMAAADQMRPPGPAVGEIVDGTLPGADGDLDYRLYRPPTDGPHPLVVYFHGGGWVLGSATSDDPLCRDLCVRSDALVVSVDYRHAPETRFPGAVDDALAAVRWLGRNG